MKKTILISIIANIALLFNSCTSLQNVSQENINGKVVEYVLQGSGNPTVVFETGMGPTIETWNTLLDSIAQHSKVYMYNRPGYGHSSLHKPPRSVKDVAIQLHENLVAQNVLPPYILVGHSAGGLYVNMFARLYPDEVVGVVFLDASHPEQFDYFRTDHPFMYNLLVTSIKKGSRHYEMDIVEKAKSDFVGASDFPNVPISVLTAGKKSSTFESKKLRKQWLVFQEELASLSSLSHHQKVGNSGHYIHRDNPGLVISEVLRIIALTKNQELQ